MDSSINNEELIELITHGREERNLEYKESGFWNDPRFRAKITKSILAMSNIQYGGAIIIGVKEDKERFIPIGIDDKSLITFKQDDVSTYVNEFADPFVEIYLSRVEFDGMQFVIIQVKEFTDLPVICKKDSVQGLRRGAIFTRPRRKNETVEVPGQVDMREIINLAIEKSIKKFKRKLLLTDIIIEKPEIESLRQFQEQLEDL